MIAVVDSGVANLTSVMAALGRLKADAEVTSDAAKIRGADKVILPGVGSAIAAMGQLQSKKLVNVLQSLTQPVLGICLGMQLLFSHSEEGPGVECLGVIKGNVKQMQTKSDMPVPHMGWNQIKPVGAEHALLKSVVPESFVYFVHSFAAPVGDYTLATTDYSETFTAVAAQGNFYGCQFHPERSSKVGAQILENFLKM